jgi:hypothetical protein
MSPGERFLLGGGSVGEVRHGEALVAAAHPEQNSVIVNHELLGTLGYSPEPLGAETTEAVARVGRAIVSADRENGYWEFAVWLGSAQRAAPLTSSDLDALEHAASQPRFEFPRDRAMAELRTIAQRIDPEHARCRASVATLRLGVPLGLLQRHAKATSWDGPEGAELKQRTSRVMMAIGRKLAASPTFVERLVGLSLAAKGAELGGDPQAAAQARQEWQTAFDRYHAGSAAMKKAGTWPFSAMCADWTPDEVGYFGRFLE